MATLKTGNKAPAFTGLDQDGNKVSLKDFAGKTLILFFYPKDMTSGCTAEACNLRDNYAELIRNGYAVVGVSPDPASSHLKFISKYTLPFPLIADTDQSICNKYEAWGEKSMYGKKYMGVIRKTFVISPEGKILHIIDKVKTDDHASQILALETA
ncbi:MAG: thioredoxin-dependent thiol peroxidase [Sphingobacteriales bacterium]|jgi:peroxiredoxin Q/BCP|nr:thioredoxin-dependent thiol peroxidase [Sphingobacteriales bacterium]